MELFNKDDDVTRMHSQICHDHVISLIGFCHENSNDEWIHVYDYMANRSLEDHIYGKGKDPLVWKKRLKICIDAARGLQYLHASGLVKDNVLIKPSKILLDEKWVAKIQIKFSPEIIFTKLDTIELYRFTNGKTPGNLKVDGINNSRYIDPNFFLYGVSVQNSAVYAFGIVLFEVLCAREELLSRLISHFGSNNIQWSTIDKVIDPYLMGQIAPKCLRAFLNIAYSCVHREETARPSMDNVLESLLSALQLQEDWET
ncbi:receptor-like protein kinase FERONIA [Actinidia eriantha]|uniref:receptor-like protein kinase FERONIA n=1 Tax=Actinidia eriantha TaxID=165200 RepID=UPI00258BA018|nr:receptor-like protein kinase FERONIA [Actinidia eriantha]